MIVVMVRIPVGSEQEGERLEGRFRNRTGLVDSYPGFLGFELLKGDGEYISMTRWADREDLDRWMASQAHEQAHTPAQPPTGGGHPAGEDSQDNAQQRIGSISATTVVYEAIIPGAERA